MWRYEKNERSDRIGVSPAADAPSGSNSAISPASESAERNAADHGSPVNGTPVSTPPWTPG